MGTDYYLLLTLLNKHEKYPQLFKIALKISSDKVHEDYIIYPMEPESRDTFSKFLPDYYQNCPIVDVEFIADIFYEST